MNEPEPARPTVARLTSVEYPNWTVAVFRAAVGDATAPEEYAMLALARDGLAVHYATLFRGKDEPAHRGPWRISHVRSGRSLPLGFWDLDSAISVADCLLDLCNWKRSEAVIKRDGALRGIIQQFQREHMARGDRE